MQRKIKATALLVCSKLTGQFLSHILKFQWLVLNSKDSQANYCRHWDSCNIEQLKQCCLELQLLCF